MLVFKKKHPVKINPSSYRTSSTFRKSHRKAFSPISQENKQAESESHPAEDLYDVFLSSDFLKTDGRLITP